MFELELKDFVLLVPSASAQEFGAEQVEGNLEFVLQHSQGGGIRVEENMSEECFHKTNVDKDRDGLIPVPFPVVAMQETLKKTFAIKTPGSYHLYFSNCVPKTQVGFDLTIREYNMVAGDKVFLSAGKASLPVWYGLLSFAFFGLFVSWCTMLLRNRQHAASIHLLMGVVVLFKAFTLFVEAFEYHWLKSTGKPHGWNVAFYVFSFVKGMLLFTVIVLIGTGWSYLKPYLTERDKQVMLAVIVVQAMVNVAMVMLDETAPGAIGWLTWRDLLHLLDMICCCAILFPIVWSIRHLSQAAESQGGQSRELARLRQFRKFYLAVVAYIYVTRVVVFLLDATLPFESTWVANAFSECASFVFYAWTGWLFRPRGRNPYMKIKADEDEEVELGRVPQPDDDGLSA